MSPDHALTVLRRFLKENDFSNGDKLPAERTLARQIGCSRETLRMCLQKLKAEGLIWQHVGQGTYLGHPPLSVPIHETVLFEAGSPQDLMEARLLIEPLIAAQAAQKATDDDVKHLYHAIEKCRTAPNQQDCELADSTFHTSLARITQNPILTRFLSYLSGTRQRAVWQHHWQKAYQPSSHPNYQTEQYDEHLRIVTAIAHKNPNAAAAAMREHLEKVNKEILPDTKKNAQSVD